MIRKIISFVFSGVIGLCLLPMFASAETVGLDWQKNYGGTNEDYFNSVVATDGGYIAVGYSDSSTIATNGERDAIIVKYDENGTKLWSNNFGGASVDGFNSVIETTDGYVAVGNSDSSTIATNGGWDAIIVKYDENGNMLWNNSYGGSNSEYFNSVITTDGGYIAVGYSYSSTIAPNGDRDAIIVKFAENGNMLWNNYYGGTGVDGFTSVTETVNGYVAVGYSVSPTIATNGSSDAIIVKFDKNGTKLWNNNYGGDYVDEFNSVIETTDGYVAVGHSNSTAIATNGDKDAVIVKFDEAGNKLWDNNYGGSRLF